MTIRQENAKKDLQYIRDFELSIKKRREKLEALRMAALPGAITYDKERVQISPKNFTEEVLCDAHDLESEIEEDLASIDGFRRVVYERVMQLTDIQEQTLLMYYYFDGYSYDSTANCMNMSTRNVYRIENDALEHYGELLEKLS